MAASTAYGSTGEASFATGNKTTAQGKASHTSGYKTVAGGDYSHAEGNQTACSGYASHVQNEHAYVSVGSGSSHAEGFGCTVSYYTTDGSTRNASGDGERLIPQSNSESQLLGAHSEGMYTTSAYTSAHAEGFGTLAKGFASHSEGYNTIALNVGSHAQGMYNIGTAIDTIHETGIGTSYKARKNAFEIYTDGTLTAPEATIANINTRGIKSLVTKEYADSLGGGASELEKITEGINTGWRLLGANPANYGDIGSGAVDFSYSGPYASATLGATGTYSFAEGYQSTASGLYSHAEGNNTIALNESSHAQGAFNIGTSPDTIHETGIGILDKNGLPIRLNAFEIYIDGTLTAPEATPERVLARGLQTLVPLGFLLSAEFGNSIPTTPGATGTLYSNAGVLTVSP